MLDFFLVLGQVPGTDIQLGFWQIMSGYLSAFLLVLFYRKYKASRKVIQQIQVIQLSSLGRRKKSA